MSTLGFVVIVILYATIGLMGAAGAIFLVRNFLGPKGEQVFYGLFLIMIAAFYLAFAAYFGSAGAWRVARTAIGLSRSASITRIWHSPGSWTTTDPVFWRRRSESRSPSPEGTRSGGRANRASSRGS